LIDEKEAKQQAYSDEKTKLSQMEYCQSELDKYLQNERNIQSKKHKWNDLEQFEIFYSNINKSAS